MPTDVKPSPSLETAASSLFAAERDRCPVTALTQTLANLSLDDAHYIQMLNLQRKVDLGERIVGYKLGLTSREAQRQFKVFSPDYGHLTDAMEVWDDGEISIADLIQPKIEGEIALVLGRDLTGPGVTVTDAIRAVDFATAALEIVDCRMRDWAVQAPDLVADNGASARFVLAPVARSVRDLDLSSVGMALSQRGEVRVTGAGAATLGSPFHALAFLANRLGKKDQSLKAGQVILTGALAAMLTVRVGESYTCEIQSLGRVCIRFAGTPSGVQT